MVFSNVSALFEIICLHLPHPQGNARSEVTRAFESVTSGSERLTIIAMAKFHSCLDALLPYIEAWRSDPAVRARLMKEVNVNHGQSCFELLIFLAVPGDSEIEDLFCQTLQNFYQRERAAIARYVSESGGGAAHEADEMAQAHAIALKAVLRFAAFGFVKPFALIEPIPLSVLGHEFRYGFLVKPVVQGNLVTREMLSAFMPPEIVEQFYGEAELSLEEIRQRRLGRLNWELAKRPASPRRSSDSPASLATEVNELSDEMLAEAVANLQPEIESDKRVAALRSLGSRLLDRDRESLLSCLLVDSDEAIRGLAFDQALSALAQSEGPLAALNFGLEQAQTPGVSLSAHRAWALLCEYGRSR